MLFVDRLRVFIPQLAYKDFVGVVGGLSLEGIFPFCPWKREAQFGVLCYECHTELLFHPVLLPEDVTHFAELVKRRGSARSSRPKAAHRSLAE